MSQGGASDEERVREEPLTAAADAPTQGQGSAAGAADAPSQGHDSAAAATDVPSQGQGSAAAQGSQGSRTKKARSQTKWPTDVKVVGEVNDEGLPLDHNVSTRLSRVCGLAA